MRAKRGTVGVGGNVVEMMRRGEGSFLLWLAASTAHPCRSPGRRKGGKPGVPMHVNFKPTATVYNVFEGAEVAFPSLHSIWGREEENISPQQRYFIGATDSNFLSVYWPQGRTRLSGRASE